MKANRKDPKEEAYQQAIGWKQKADRYCSPPDYRIAARYFEIAERFAEAAECLEKAKFYSR